MTKSISALQIQKNNKERVNVFLDDEYAFALNLMAASKLRKGQQLSSAEIEKLQAEDNDHKAFEASLRYLGTRPRSEDEIHKYLRRKKVSDETIQSVILRLRQLGYLDDAAFSQFWTENRQQFRPRSARALRYELRQKGVDDDVIDTSLEAIDEDEAAWAAIEKKLARWQFLEPIEFEKKLKGFLARRGFGYETVNRVWKRVKGEVRDEG